MTDPACLRLPMTDQPLLRLTRRADPGAPTDGAVSLTFDQRERSRLRVRLDDGREAGIVLARGETLRDGDRLTGEEGVVVRVRAAPEPLSTAASDDPLLLARACYHLGNRHVALQIGPGRLAWLHDHVLDNMVRGLGLTVTLEQAPFQPEPGAYGGHARGHGHHGHDH
jgi:urease accessory protein